MGTHSHKRRINGKKKIKGLWSRIIWLFLHGLNRLSPFLWTLLTLPSVDDVSTAALCGGRRSVGRYSVFNGLYPRNIKSTVVIWYYLRGYYNIDLTTMWNKIIVDGRTTIDDRRKNYVFFFLLNLSRSFCKN